MLSSVSSMYLPATLTTLTVTLCAVDSLGSGCERWPASGGFGCDGSCRGCVSGGGTGCGCCGTGCGFCSSDHAINCGPGMPSVWPGAGDCWANANATLSKIIGRSIGPRFIRHLPPMVERRGGRLLRFSNFGQSRQSQCTQAFVSLEGERSAQDDHAEAATVFAVEPDGTNGVRGTSS